MSKEEAIEKEDKRGKWVLKKIGYENYNLCCSNCGKVIHGFGMTEEEALEWIAREAKEHKEDISPNFCSRCGADMR